MMNEQHLEILTSLIIMLYFPSYHILFIMSLYFCEVNEFLINAISTVNYIHFILIIHS